MGLVWRRVLGCLTLEGADKVAPEPGLLGEGGVVGVEVEVHLAHSGVAAAHPEKKAKETQTSASFLTRWVKKTTETSKKLDPGEKRSSKTATYRRRFRVQTGLHTLHT